MSCPICGNKTSNLIIKSFLKNFHFCKVCRGHFLYQKPEPRYLKKYFQEDRDPSLIGTLTAPFLNFFFSLKVKKIKSLLKDRKSPQVLDYGCGSGRLIDNLLKGGFSAYGFEPSKDALVIGWEKNLPVSNRVKRARGGYDLIMFWHSLEHINNPLMCIKKIKNYLKRDGILLIAVPNASSIEARLATTKWFHYSYPLHRIQFTPYAIETMLRRAGFRTTHLDFFNPEYTLTGLLQTLLNLFLPKDTLYRVVSNRQLSMTPPKAFIFAALSLVVTLFFSPVIISFYLFELIFKNTGAMVIIAENENKYSMQALRKQKADSGY